MVSQANGGYGGVLGSYARNNFVRKSYTEGNSGGEGIIEAFASQNRIFASRAVTLTTGWTDSSSNRSNQLNGHHSSVGETGSFDTTPWYWPYDLNQFSEAASVALRQYVSINLTPSELRTEVDPPISSDPTSTGTKWTVATRTSHYGLEDKLEVNNDGDLEILKDRTLRINGEQVLKSPQPGWSLATGTADRATFDTTTVTLPELAERVKALIDDLHVAAGMGILRT